MTADELVGAKLDGKNFSRSAARLDIEGVGDVVGVVKLTEMMRGRLKAQGSTLKANPLVGRRLQDARLIMDGMVAVQEYTGKPFDVADDTVISRTGMTWGEAKKLDTRMGADKASGNVRYE